MSSNDSTLAQVFALAERILAAAAAVVAAKAAEERWRGKL